LNLQRYVNNNPLRFSDPSGLTAAIETATTRGGTTGSGAGIFNLGMRLNCLFTAVSAAIELAGTPNLETLDLVTAGSDTAMACGAKAKYKKKKDRKEDDDKKICPLTCFAAGTKVHTREGLKSIEDIVPGDEVKSMDPVTGEIAYKKVLNTHINRFGSTGTVSLVDETDGSQTHLSVTAEHPFYHAEKGWVHASKLVAGDILTEDDGGTLRVADVIFNANAPINTTYNLEVADFHTYFVGEDGVLVHNGWGAYVISDGINWYFGKGDTTRMNASIKRLFQAGTVTHVEFFPATCDRSSFKKEHELMMSFTGGAHPRDIKNILNKILSPGAKY